MKQKSKEWLIKRLNIIVSDSTDDEIDNLMSTFVKSLQTMGNKAPIELNGLKVGDPIIVYIHNKKLRLTHARKIVDDTIFSTDYGEYTFPEDDIVYNYFPTQEVIDLFKKSQSFINLLRESQYHINDEINNYITSIQSDVTKQVIEGIDHAFKLNEQHVYQYINDKITKFLCNYYDERIKKNGTEK